ncbi:ImmA/IrrE family metallo-endopeptidase [Pelagibius litoralis]|uniref:ImmA/IrrE family metallo-endopeptidase n=1 Tax=Pelagibius litoralis TaxID=374515 RepID=A0A967F2L9_9PROT|nr:ImmA/IrrE family metallo-endopeptidase [Pelagibius litoralis]
MNKNDPEDEQRLTIAHEVAHLLLHYLKPRKDAVAAFGPQILAVLDRTRSSTHGEKLSAALRDVPIEPFRHAMDRRQLHLAGRVAAMEDEADDLAIELLAPWREVRSMSDPSADSIRRHFGLPAIAAARLATMIQPTRTSSGVTALFGKIMESKS